MLESGAALMLSIWASSVAYYYYEDVVPGDLTVLDTGEDHTDDVNSASFSPDSSKVLSASRDSTIKLWDAADLPSPLDTGTGHTDWVFSASFSPDGSRIVSASDDETIKLWNAADLTVLHKFTVSL